VGQRNGKKLIVAIYFDDGLIAGSDESKIGMFIDQFHRNFRITTGTFSILLGMQIEQRRDGIFVCQRVYTEKVLE
jgi:hypothetical protein